MWETFGLIFYALAFFCLGILFTVVIILYIDAKDMEKEMDAYDKEIKKEDKE
jgi:hypothetical protein